MGKPMKESNNRRDIGREFPMGKIYFHPNENPYKFNMEDGLLALEMAKLEALRKAFGFMHYNSAGATQFFTERNIIMEI